jgi:hypothetical protein
VAKQVTCDLCGGTPAFETTLTISRTIPPEGEASRQNKSRKERHTSIHLGDLCDGCTGRYSVAVGNLAADVKLGNVTLPEVPAAEEATQEPSGDQQEQLSLGGTDADGGPDAYVPAPEDVLTDGRSQQKANRKHRTPAAAG